MKKNDNLEIIPIMHCFNNNYVIPASVAFLSMLENANKNYFYKLYVLHSDITKINQILLTSLVNKFGNATLEFIDMKNKFEDMFEKTKIKGHCSKEMYYKLIAPEIFLEYEKIIITDVDVIYKGDISKEFINFKDNNQDYVAGVQMPKLKDSWLENFMENCYFDWTKDEREKLLIGAGYMIFNLEKLRQDNCVQKFLDCANQNLNRLKQPEQDVINTVCYPKIKSLPLKSMVCTYAYDLYKNETDFNNDLRLSSEELHDALENPIQVHYATYVKPWNNKNCTKADMWYSCLKRLPLFLIEFVYKKFAALIYLKTKNDQRIQYRILGIKITINKNKKDF